MNEFHDNKFFFQHGATFRCRNHWNCEKCPVCAKCEDRQNVAERWQEAIAAGAEDDLG